MFRSNYRSIEIVSGPSFWRSAGLVALALFVQTVFAPLLVVRAGIPSFVTIAVVLYALRVGARRGALLGVTAGVLTDAVTGTGGAWTLSYTALAMLCGGITRGFFADGVVLPSLFVGVAVVVRNAMFWIIMAAEGYPRGYGAVHLHAALESGALTAVYAFVYLLFRSRFGGEPTRIERYA
ncbi:MAG TPA: rod shape-determining protein MreD [Candidatus Lustribacter sp.]|nr:rod shape-determining protein MreD [Candidatus Lustribacter sp.]